MRTPWRSLAGVALPLALAACGGSSADDDPIHAALGTWVTPCVQPLFSPVFRQEVLVVSKTGPGRANVLVRHDTYPQAGCSGATDTSTSMPGTLTVQLGGKTVAGVAWTKSEFTFPTTTRRELFTRDGDQLVLSVQLEVIEQPNTGPAQRDAEGYPDAFTPVRLRPAL